jgi:dienelactone hydrolase
MMVTALHAQTPSSPVSTDPPADSVNPASLVEIAVPSHGAQLPGAFYLVSGSRPHPAAIIFHDFPGYEQNPDLAQTLRRAGYNVLAVHYRGIWGVSGNFSYQHAIEDADAEVEWITSAEVAAKYRVDSTRIVLPGHSMGGYMALSAAAHHAGVAATIAISGASHGHRFAGLKPEDKEKAVAQAAGRIDPADLLPFLKLAPAPGKRPILLITANDGSGPNSDARCSKHSNRTQILSPCTSR